MYDNGTEMNFDELRNLTPAERRRRFLAYKNAREAHARHESRVLGKAIGWHIVDDPMTTEQINELPPCVQAMTHGRRQSGLSSATPGFGRSLYREDGSTLTAVPGRRGLTP
jgi:hypothetical protein